MNFEIEYYFTYNDNDEYKLNLDILVDVFGEYILNNINDDASEKIVDIKLNEFNSDHMIDLLCAFDQDEIRVLLIADTLIIGTDRHLNEMGL